MGGQPVRTDGHSGPSACGSSLGQRMFRAEGVVRRRSAVPERRDGAVDGMWDIRPRSGAPETKGRGRRWHCDDVCGRALPRLATTFVQLADWDIRCFGHQTNSRCTIEGVDLQNDLATFALVVWNERHGCQSGFELLTGQISDGPVGSRPLYNFRNVSSCSSFRAVWRWGRPVMVLCFVR